VSVARFRSATDPVTEELVVNPEDGRRERELKTGKGREWIKGEPAGGH